MPHIVLTEEQVRVLTEVGLGGQLEVRNPQGQSVASLRVFDAWDLEAIERHKHNQGKKREPGIPSARVQAFLQKLHEIAEREGIDEAKVRELLRRERAGEPL
jgi:hypothetical protein